MERLSQQNGVIKICTDTGLLTTVGVGPYFTTKDTEEFSQFTESMACREYILPRDEKSSDPKGWIRGNTKIEPVLKITTCCLQGKYGVEIRIGLNKFVSDLSNEEYDITDLSNNKEDHNEQETSQMKFEKFALKTNVLAFASRSKAKAKPPACSSTRTLPIGERSWSDVEPGTYSHVAFSVSKRLSTLFRHGDPLREEDWAIVFW